MRGGVADLRREQRTFRGGEACPGRVRQAVPGRGQRDDASEVGALEVFRKDVSSFVRLYDFMSQVVNYGDSDLEGRAIFLRVLERVIRADTVSAEIDLSGVVRKKDRKSVV